MKTLFFILFIVSLDGLGQNYERIVLDPSDRTGYYLAVRPPGNIEGVLVLIGGFGDIPENVFPETKLHNTAYVNNILTIVLSLGNKIYADQPTINNINRALRDTIMRFSVQRDKFVIGGMSAGGTIALRYVEHCIESPSDFPVVPKAVFAVDSPVDLLDIWDYFDRELERNFSEVGMAEARFVKEVMKNDLGGTPQTHLGNYIAHSPFYRMQKEVGNERFLKNTPVRSYHDPDLVWQLKNRRRSAYDNNAACASELIARLMLMGNERAELVVSNGTGYRANGMRHPHSWSIVDEEEFIQWMKAVLKS